MIRLIICLSLLVASCKPGLNSGLKAKGGFLKSKTTSAVTYFVDLGNGEVNECTGSIIVEEEKLFLLTVTQCLEENTPFLMIEIKNIYDSSGSLAKKIGDFNHKIHVEIFKALQFGPLNPRRTIEAKYDFAMAYLEKEKLGEKLYSKLRQIALPIGYDVPTENLNGNVKVITGGLERALGDSVSSLNDFNDLSVSISRQMELIQVKTDKHYTGCKSSCLSDSGSPLVYVDPNSGKRSVVGLLHGGQMPSENIYVNFSGNRFPRKMRSLINYLSCK